MEIVKEFDNNEAKLKELMNKKGRLAVSDINVWREKADDIVGESLDKFSEYIAYQNDRRTTIFSFDMSTLRATLVKWVVYENLKRHGGTTTDLGNETDTIDGISIVQEDGQYMF